jgi:hypothetical protein
MRIYFELLKYIYKFICIMNKQTLTQLTICYTALYLSLLDVSTLMRPRQRALIRCLLIYINVLTL